MSTELTRQQKAVLVRHYLALATLLAEQLDNSSTEVSEQFSWCVITGNAARTFDEADRAGVGFCGLKPTKIADALKGWPSTSEPRKRP